MKIGRLRGLQLILKARMHCSTKKKLQMKQNEMNRSYNKEQVVERGEKKRQLDRERKRRKKNDKI